jgi:hypothetical protein
MRDKLRIIITGLIGQHNTMGGVTWDYVQYAIGLKNLGHDVYYFEDSGEWPYNLDGGSTGNTWEAEDCQANIGHIHSVMKTFGLGEKWAYKCPLSGSWYGLSDTIREEIIGSADLLINVSGTLEHPEHYRKVKRLAYIDSDPGFTQIKMESVEFAYRVLVHDVHFSFGELLGTAFGIEWHPTRSPIVLSEWQIQGPLANKYTTIMNWTSYKPLTRGKKVYAQKDAEFVKFIELPQKYHNSEFEVAMSELQHDNWKTKLNGSLMDISFEKPQDLLKYYGWKVANTQQVCQNPESYRSYIVNSRGEWSVAKGGYVIDKTGWFSCRSACYLAAGKPVVVQSTGFEEILPVGEGLFAFNDMREVVSALESIEGNYAYHCKSARALAREYLDSDIILNKLLETALN